METWVAIAFGIYFGLTAGSPWSRTIGGVLLITVILAAMSLWLTVSREKQYVRDGVVPEYRPLTTSKAILGFGYCFIMDGALLTVVAMVTYGVKRLLSS